MKEYRAGQIENIVEHMQTQQEDFIVWEDCSGNDNTDIIKSMINKYNLPYTNNGCFMGAHAWAYKV
jgi:hypothetical protein